MDNRIGQARREYASKHGKFSQKDAAEYFGVSLSTYQKWEQGQGMMNGEQLRAIAEKYETTTDFLLGRTDISYAYIVVPKGVDDAAPEMERCKVEYAAAAASRAMDEQAGSFDVGDFADFLQFGATLDRGAVLASFVHQVLVLDGEVVVTLLVDDEKGDPLRLSFPAVRPNVVWLPWQHSMRNMRIAVSGGAVLIAFAA